LGDGQLEAGVGQFLGFGTLVDRTQQSILKRR
jgi:hypothetical protein